MNTSSINLLQTVEQLLASGVRNRHTKRKLFVLLKRVKQRRLPIEASKWPNLATAIVRFYGERNG